MGVGAGEWVEWMENEQKNEWKMFACYGLIVTFFIFNDFNISSEYVSYEWNSVRNSMLVCEKN